MTIKQLIENHPLPILVGIAVLTASTTAGVVKFVDESKFDNLKTQYEFDISALKTRIVSIERKLGNDEKTYFDVSQLVIPPDRIKTLDASYRSTSDNGFFFLSPIGESWKHEVTSEAGLVALKLGSNDIEKVREVLPALSEKTINLWRKDQTFTLSTKAKKGLEEVAPKTLRYFPKISVQTISEAQLKGALGALSKLFDRKLDISALTKKLENLAAGIENSNSPNASGSRTNKLDTSEPLKSEKPPVNNESDAKIADKQLEMEQFLSVLFRGDMVGMWLGGIIQQAFTIPQLLDGVEVTLNSVQKKGNVLYIQMSQKFDAAKVVEFEKPTTLIVDKEIFVVTNTKNMYVVDIEVPSTDGRSDAYPWVGQMLSSIRIPL